jgi:hypothetical protein
VELSRDLLDAPVLRKPPQPDLADAHLGVDLPLLAATVVCSSLFLISFEPRSHGLAGWAK